MGAMPMMLANSGDPDQTQHSAASDLDLHCLPMSHMTRLIWVKVCLLYIVRVFYQSVVENGYVQNKQKHSSVGGTIF